MTEASSPDGEDNKLARPRTKQSPHGVEFQFCKMKKFWRSVSQQCEYS